VLVVDRTAGVHDEAGPGRARTLRSQVEQDGYAGLRDPKSGYALAGLLDAAPSTTWMPRPGCSPRHSGPPSRSSGQKRFGLNEIRAVTTCRSLVVMSPEGLTPRRDALLPGPTGRRTG
jgi:hypothetical protein